MVPKNVPLLNILKNHGKSKYDFFPNPPEITIAQCSKSLYEIPCKLLVGLECDFSYWIIQKFPTNCAATAPRTNQPTRL
jgi:hypothetical protein